MIIKLEGYTYISTLGVGQATTWLAYSISKNNEVVIKTLELSRVSDWKGIELFERELRVLQQLSHPSIPKYICFRSDGSAETKRWHIVQEKIDGDTIKALLDGGRVFSEGEVRKFALTLLKTLQYLQSFSPPLIHRDVKPENLILRKDRVWLVDFGSVRHVIPSRLGGSTIVGTSGYMAPEQLLGRATSSSDLYALGMTLIHMLTGHHPEEFAKKNLRILWEGKGVEDSSLKFFLNCLISPNREDRFSDSTSALEFLQRDLESNTDGDWKEKSLIAFQRQKKLVLNDNDSSMIRYSHPIVGMAGLLSFLGFVALISELFAIHSRILEFVVIVVVIAAMILLFLLYGRETDGK